MNAKLLVCILFLALPLLMPAYNANAEPLIFNITAFGATPELDINQSLLNAWKAGKESKNSSKIVIPVGTWKLSQVILQGPNLGPLEIENQGSVEAYPDLQIMADKFAPWITINSVNNFNLSGGVYNGQGRLAWASNNCRTKQNCRQLPINLRFNNITNSIIQDVTTIDSKFFHIKCASGTNVSFARVTVSAPGDSPNTDGINMVRSTNISVTDSVIATGDDCISMGPGLTGVHIHNVSCGPGHGISIGSLGRYAGEKDVSGIYVGNCSFNQTTNGARIKTFPSGPAALRVSDVQFQDLIMYNAANPVIINQKYCPNNQCNLTGSSLVQISNVTINNVRGSTSSENAVSLICSEEKPCEDVMIGDVDLTYTGSRGKFGTTCVNVKPIFNGTQKPPICAASSLI